MPLSPFTVAPHSSRTASLKFQDEYEQYIKHYPLSEAYHRKELRRNPKYQYFLSQCGQDPRIRRRDLITFLSRPVTRLPRLLLLLTTTKKYTPADHSEQETLSLLISILGDFIKSTQPGIEAAESKVKFWELCESLSYQKGEIIVSTVTRHGGGGADSLPRTWICMTKAEPCCTQGSLRADTPVAQK